MSTVQIAGNLGFDTQDFWIQSAAQSTNESFSGLISSTGGPLSGYQEQKYSELLFRAGDKTYHYIGEWILTASRGVLSGTARANGYYTSINVEDNGSTEAIYNGAALNVDFGTRSGLNVLNLLGDLAGGLISLLFGDDGSSQAYANLHLTATPNLPEIAFSDNTSAMGGGGYDVLSTYAGNDTLDGRLGGSLLSGGSGDDVYIVHSQADVVVELSSQGAGNDTVLANGTDYSLAISSVNVESLVLLSANHTGSGTNGNDTVTSYGINNVLVGGGGDDTFFVYSENNSLYGGTGNDAYVVTSQSDRVFEDVGIAGGVDTVFASDTDFSLALSAPNVETLVILTSDHIGAGSDANDRLIAFGNNDILFGGAGNDTLISYGQDNSLNGSIGDDAYIVDSRSVKIGEGASEGYDAVYADRTDFSLADAPNAEALILRGNGHTGAGTNGNDLLKSVGISNQLFGGGGNDTFAFDGAHGQSTVLDFNARPGEHDIIAVLQAQYGDFASISSHMTQDGQDTIIVAVDGSGDSLLIKGVGAASLQASDFYFV